MGKTASVAKAGCRQGHVGGMALGAVLAGLILSGCDTAPPLTPEGEQALMVCAQDPDPVTAIAACTAVIDAGRGGVRVQSIARIARATHHEQLERYHQAIEDYDAVIALLPAFDAARLHRVGLYERTAQYSAAIADLDHLLAKTPNDPGLMNYLAWLLATCPSQAHRDGPRAVALALAVIRVQPDYATIDTMAAAYAASGEFAKAAHEQRIAILALRAGPQEAREAFMAEFYQRLGLYLAGRPYILTYDQVRHAPMPAPDFGDLLDVL